MTEYKMKRNERLLYIAHYLTERPCQIIKFTYFQEKLNAAKSSISEDVNLIRQLFQDQELGLIETLTGVTGGVVFYPIMFDKGKAELFDTLASRLSKGPRILQGNYIYMNDILQDSHILKEASKLIVSKYYQENIDYVMTVESKGIGLACSVANLLSVPFIFVRTDSTDTIGSTISVNYVSGSYHTVKKMELAKSSLKNQSRVLIVDDFLRNGGTVRGMVDLIHEFECETVGICVLGENASKINHREIIFDSLVKLDLVYSDSEQCYTLQVKPGTLLE